MQPLSGNQRPDLLTSLMNMSFVLRLPRKMHLCRSSSNVPFLPSFLEMLQNPHVLLTFDKVHNPLRLPRETRSDRRVFCTFWLWNVLRATTACTFSTSQLPKVVRTWGVFSFFTCKCASRHNLSQRRALFRHLNLQKWSEHDVFCTFWLRNVLRATIFHLSSGQMAPHPPLWRAYFSTLRSHKSLEKHSVSRLSYLFAHLRLLSSDSFSSLIFPLLLFSLTLPISAFHLSILSEVWLLNFLRLHNPWLVEFVLNPSSLQELDH